MGYAIDGAHGKWTFGLNCTDTFFQDQQRTATAPVFDFVNTVGKPVKLRFAAQLGWSSEGWTVLTTVNHTGAYEDPGAVPARGVDAWTTVDVNLGYRIDGGSGRLAQARFNLGLNDALDQRPPFINQFDLGSGTLGYARPTPVWWAGRSACSLWRIGGREPAFSLNLHGNRNPPSRSVHVRRSALRDN